MARWELLGTVPIPGDGGELRLLQRDSEFSIRFTGIQGELMNSRTHGSEDALGRIPCEALVAQPGVRVLIGGLGMGFTLRAALDCLGADAQVEVAELVPGVIRWNQEHLGQCAGHPLEDPRVEVVSADVAQVIRGARTAYDAILLDVDNGPEGLTHPDNDQLYASDGLAAAYGALKPRGTLAVWSASPSKRFSARLKATGFSVTEERVRAHGGKGARHVIWLARR